MRRNHFVAYVQFNEDVYKDEDVHDRARYHERRCMARVPRRNVLVDAGGHKDVAEDQDVHDDAIHRG